LAFIERSLKFFGTSPGLVGAKRQNLSPVFKSLLLSYYISCLKLKKIAGFLLAIKVDFDMRLGVIFDYQGDQ
jgi:hypothetical protein